MAKKELVTIKGSSWISFAVNCRAADRYRWPTNLSDYYDGFRIVLRKVTHV